MVPMLNSRTFPNVRMWKILPELAPSAGSFFFEAHVVATQRCRANGLPDPEAD